MHSSHAFDAPWAVSCGQSGRLWSVVLTTVHLHLPTNTQHQHVDDFGMGGCMKGATRIGCCMIMVWREVETDNSKCAVP